MSEDESKFMTMSERGPRGSLAARARLLFATAVDGPLLLGRGNHFGMENFEQA